MKKLLQKNYDVSIIIPNYNSKEELFHCLDSIYNQKTKYKFEVIVVDSSDEDPSEKIRSRFPSAKVFHYNRRIYPGTARNLGVKKAKSKFLAFTDADCLVDTRWVEKLFMAQQGNIGVIGGSIINGHNKSLIATAEYFIEFGEFMPSRKFGKSRVLLSGNFMIEKPIYEGAGGFKDIINGEDVLFFHELVRQGNQLYFDPTVIITHFNRTEFKHYLSKQKEQGVGSYFLRKKATIAGSWLTKHKLYSLLIPAIRSAAIIKKVLINDHKKIFILIITYPIIFIGLIAYAVGFWQTFNSDYKS